MAKYAVFFSLTPEATKGFIQNPTDRREAVRGLIEPAGGRVEAYYWMFGPYDGLVIFETPDAQAAAAIALAVTASGAFKFYQTCELIESSDLAGIAQKAGQAAAAFRPPGQPGQ